MCSNTEKQYTYKELEEAVIKWATYLQNYQFPSHTTPIVAIFSSNVIEYEIFVLGCMAAGIIFTTVVPSATSGKRIFLWSSNF